jgi:glycosyltransferase involved in cell wall biosynthesis
LQALAFGSCCINFQSSYEFPGAAAVNAPPILLYLVTEDWYFLSHRLPMALAAQRAGYDVHVAARVGRGGAAIQNYGFTLHPLNWPRGSLYPIGRWRLWRDVRALYRATKPDLVHHVALEPTIIGSLAALGCPIVQVNALAGLGYVFTSRSVKARIVSFLVEKTLALLLNRARTAALVQNADDREALISLGVEARRIFMIAGSGVDVDRLIPLPEPDGPITIAFVGRLLDDKGIRVLIAAKKILDEKRVSIRLLIAGEPDMANPASIPHAEIDNWRRLPGVSVLGHVANIETVWQAAHIAVLPSRREGLPKSLLEAAACGRPLIATDVPGCRAIARAGVNALLVPVDEPAALAAAIETLAANPALRRRFSVAGRELVENEFASSHIGGEVVTLYDRLLARKAIAAQAGA